MKSLSDCYALMIPAYAAVPRCYSIIPAPMYAYAEYRFIFKSCWKTFNEYRSVFNVTLPFDILW